MISFQLEIDFKTCIYAELNLKDSCIHQCPLKTHIGFNDFKRIFLNFCTPGFVYTKVAQMVEILGLPQVDRTGEGRKEEETLIEPQIEKHFQNKQQWPTTEICKPSSTFTRSPCKSTQPPATEHQCQKSAKSTQVQQLQAMVGGKAKFARGATF